jgi:flagellar biosynthesis protein FliP
MLRLIEVMAAFAVVLAALYATLLLLRRHMATSRRAGAVDMEVLGRLALGPRQGMAVVRVGGRTVALSTGDGGVRRLFDIEAEDTGPAEGVIALPAAPASAGFGRELQAALGRRLTLLRRSATALLLVLAVAVPAVLDAQQAGGAGMPGATAADLVSQLGPAVDLRVGDGSGPDSLRLSGTVGIILMMGMLTLLPTLILMMTAFTRIFVVLSFLKQAMGTQTAPPAQLVAAFALLLTGFVMQPTLSEANRTALQPWLNGEIEQAEMMQLGAEPFREFMLAQTRDSDIEAFVEMSQMEQAPTTVAEVPMTVLMSAFVTSELKTAFQIGFLLFIPFIIIDLVVAAVLMSMGMFMLPPAMIALPFKLMLFVLVDGWVLVVQGLVASFR